MCSLCMAEDLAGVSVSVICQACTLLNSVSWSVSLLVSYLGGGVGFRSQPGFQRRDGWDERKAESVCVG